MWRTDSLENPWCWEILKAGGEGDNREWDGWMASLNQWTWVWASSGSLWWIGKPGMLQSMGSQRVEHNWVTELNWKSRGVLPSWMEPVTNGLMPWEVRSVDIEARARVGPWWKWRPMYWETQSRLRSQCINVNKNRNAQLKRLSSKEYPHLVSDNTPPTESEASFVCLITWF